MLSLALPKGSLEEQTMLLFAQADLEAKKSSRAYNPIIDDPRIERVKILRPQEIPLFVQSGYFDIGISGFDWVTESGADVVQVAELPYAKTGTGVVKLVLAVPDDSPINCAADIKPGSRISTEFPNVTKAFFEKLGIPVTTAWNSHDLLWNSHRCYAGRPGTLGDRAGNFVVQNADLVVAMGCRLSIRQVGYNWENFAPSARLIAIDIDRAELEKPTIRVDVPVHANVRDIIREMLDVVGDTSPGVEHESWLAWCRERVARYPTVLPEYWESKGPANPYCFVAALFSQLAQGEVVVCADGTACAVTFHAAVLREGQRLYHNSGSAPMGYDLPAAIGACFARGRKPVTCLAGDGSIMMNLQELQTIATHRLPIRIFVLNNGGYHSIRQTQHAYFPDNPVGFDRPSGVGFPDFELLARAFSIRYSRCSSNAELVEAVENVLATDGPMICEVLIDQAQPFAPKLSSRKNPDGTMVSSRLEDMSPFLSREELSANMLPPSFRFRR